MTKNFHKCTNVIEKHDTILMGEEWQKSSENVTKIYYSPAV
jgi:hypothetical protein